MNKIRSISYSSGKIYTTGLNVLQKWDYNSRTLERIETVYKKEITSLLICPSRNFIITGASADIIKVLNINDLSLIKNLQSNDGFDLAISSDSNYLLSTNNSGVILWDLNSLGLLKYYNFESIINSVEFSNQTNSFFIVNALSELVQIEILNIS